jgi:hypothetical protein
MTFKNEHLQNEWPHIEAAYKAIASRPNRTAETRSLLNQLRSIISGHYGNGALQQLLRDVKQEAKPESESRELKMGKQGGGALRRSQPPALHSLTPNRKERLAQKAEREGRSGTPVVVAGGSLVVDVPANTVAIEFVEPSDLQTGDTTFLAVSDGPNIAHDDISDLSGKEVAERYGREAMEAYLLSTGATSENLESKTDRQLANMVKKAKEQ